MKSLEFYENYITPMSGKKLFDNIILTQNHAWHMTQSGWINYLEKATIKEQHAFCHVFCLGIHSNVMLRFMVQALQDPPLCSSTVTDTGGLAWLANISANFQKNI